jgi:hypothetical protein
MKEGDTSMDNETIVQRGLDLLNLMSRDPKTIWDTLDERERTKVESAFHRFNEIALSVQREEDDGKSMQAIIALATDVVRLVNETNELRTLLLPQNMISLDEPVVLGAYRTDLGDTENKQREQAQKFAAQMHNNLVIIRNAVSDKKSEKPQPTQQQKQQ